MRSPNRAAVAVAASGAFLAFLDTTIVNIAFPSISASFPHAMRSELSWVLDAYFVVIAALLVPAGALAERLGARRTFLWAVGGFACTSALCAAAPSWQVLVAARVLQGVAASVLAPVTLALMLDEYPHERRATGVGIWGASAALAAAIGPTLGGAIVDGASWRWIFFVNVPLGAAIVLSGRAAVGDRPPVAGRWPDLAGALIAAAGLGLLALGIVEGPAWGWLDGRTLAALGASALALAALARRILDHPAPIVEPALLRIPSFSRGNLGTLLFATAFFSAILGNVLFLTGVWRYSVLQAGMATIPGPLLTTIVSGPAGRLADRFGHRVVIVPGALLFMSGLLVFHAAGPARDYLGTWVPGAALSGIGIGLAFPTLGAAAVRDIAPEQFASASAVNAAFRQIGAALGTAILIAVIGQPHTFAGALSAAHRGYFVGIFAALAAAVVGLTLPTGRVARAVGASGPVVA